MAWYTSSHPIYHEAKPSGIWGDERYIRKISRGHRPRDILTISNEEIIPSKISHTSRGADDLFMPRPPIGSFYFAFALRWQHSLEIKKRETSPNFHHVLTSPATQNKVLHNAIWGSIFDLTISWDLLWSVLMIDLVMGQFVKHGLVSCCMIPVSLTDLQNW